MLLLAIDVPSVEIVDEVYHFIHIIFFLNQDILKVKFQNIVS